MRAAKYVLTAALLSSCGDQTPDFRFTVGSPNKRAAVYIMGFQPRGTVEGSIVVSFANSTDGSKIDLVRVKNGSIGWLNNHTVFVVGDRIEYRGIDSYYYPDGTEDNKVRLITCIRVEQSCKLIDKAIEEGAKNVKIAKFPEG